MRNLKIQTKLTLGFGLQLALVAVVASAGLFGLNHVQQSYHSAAGHGLEVERLAGEIKTELLEARRAEKDFLLDWQLNGFPTANGKHVVKNRQHVDRIRIAVAALESLQGGNTESSVETRIRDDLVALKPYVEVYAQDFQAAVELVGHRESREGGVEERIQATLQRVEEELYRRPETLASLREYLPRLRQNEKDYGITGKKRYASDVRQLAAAMKKGIASSPGLRPHEKAGLTGLVEENLTAFNNLSSLQAGIATKIADIHTAASIVEPLAADIAASGKEAAKAEIADAQAATRRSEIMMSVGVLAAISTGLGLAYVLGKQIKQPLQTLARTAEAVGAGDLNAQAQVGSNDEIGSLAASFNAMTGRIRGLVDSLEQRVAERHSAEEALRSSKRLLQNIIDTSTAVIFVKDLEGRYLLINRRYEEIFHVTNQSVLGKTDYDLFSREQADILRANDHRALSEGRALEMEEVVPHDDGLHTYISIKCPLRLETGQVHAVCGIATDITERIHMEERLRQSQKMEAVGRLAGGIAHDFNNILTAINGYSELALQGMEPHHPLHESLVEILKAGKRAEGLTHQLLAYSRKQILEPKVWQLNAIVSDMETMFRRLIGEDIHLATILASDLGLVKLDRGQLEQILVNLVLNARDAMPGGGELTVETANAYLDQDFASIHFEVVPGPHVMLAVSDTGTGMTDAVKARIFEPFFTTKEPGKGTGLGLSSVYGIVKQSGGSIWVYSEYGKGSTFRLYFPQVRSEGGPASEANEKPNPESYRGKETIMLVEDEDFVRTFASQVLERQGYSVLQAKDGKDGLKLLQETDRPVRLVITDVVMPNMGGYDLVVNIHLILPELPILFISGYTENSVLHQGVLDEREDFLQKPFSPMGLSRKVREILDRVPRDHATWKDVS